MATFTALSGLISLAVGWRLTLQLFRLARHTGEMPEHMLALTFGGLFCVGFPLGAASRAPGLVETHEGSLLFGLAVLGMCTGIAALNRFPQIVFRPDTLWAIALSRLITIVGVISGVGCVIAVASAASQAQMVEAIEPWSIALMGSVAAPFGWNAVESTLYYWSMKKRARLGLADPVTTHRFLLWALASGTATAQIAAVISLRATGMPVLSPLPMSIIASCALLSSICWSLGFFMPGSYRDWLASEPPGPAPSAV